LKEHPVILNDEYLTPVEAAKLAGVSRPVIVEMLKSQKLIGHRVGTHWRVKRDSLLAYIEGRDQASRAVSSMDEDGFGLD
jgi:excisionase family DNA binding protein